jgi:magnesium chelatase subunit D
LRVVRRRQRRASVAIFVVDASGSAALNRLAEAKGAVELLLADCYVRRDQVALIAFRGRQAELLLPPTRSLARARRLLAGLPGGGGTPLCAGIEAATDLADGVRRRGQSPLVVLLTDGRPNVARDGMGGRPRAEADSLAAAQRLRVSGMPALMVDVAPLPHPFAAQIATAMGARYLALPAAQSATITRAVQAALAG